MRKTLTALAALSAVLSAPLAAAAPQAAPQLTETSAAPIAAPYPDSSLASVQVKEAFATAKKTGRKVLLDFGANWCPDCRMLAGVFALPDAQGWLESQFVIVPVNVDRFTHNMDIALKYGVKVKAIPTVILLTPEGRPLNGDASLALGNARSMSPQATLDLISSWNQRG
ncbi:protein disulfide isomerase [Neokomagataea thailandica NBRC 106555]|uniref:Thioredoxin n=2 Tax=Neokomagataea TaxID=1223423 RepID=A0A4Y6V5J9_9PROT|nr:MULTISPECIES: thioredoxin family protein [Neokomagataea]QDH24148.1 thioredoxin [Neokomagataea tanensis]GBR50525.1 protein disulfide isomerase [Neokomagataea thailandica NBRC 106555]